MVPPMQGFRNTYKLGGRDDESDLISHEEIDLFGKGEEPFSKVKTDYPLFTKSLSPANYTAKPTEDGVKWRQHRPDPMGMKTERIAKKNKEFQRRIVWSPEDNELGEDEPEKPIFRKKQFMKTAQDDLVHKFTQAVKKCKAEKVNMKRLAPYMQITTGQLRIIPKKKKANIKTPSPNPPPPPPPPKMSGFFHRKSRPSLKTETLEFEPKVRRKSSDLAAENEQLAMGKYRLQKWTCEADESVSLDGSCVYNDEYGVAFVV